MPSSWVLQLAIIAALGLWAAGQATPQEAAPPTVVDLNGEGWKAVSSNGSVSVPAFVPGTVHLDLLRAGVINDPYYRYNDIAYRWIALDDWTYSRSFSVPSSLLSHTEIILVCEGLDTVATVVINGRSIGRSDNMFRRYLFSVPHSILRAGYDNTITVSFMSAQTYAQERAAVIPYELPFADNLTQQSGAPFRNYIRKEQCSFSWDWGPCFMPQGIWKPLNLLGFSSPIITALVPQTYVIGAPGSTTFRVEVETVLRMPLGSSSLRGKLHVSVAGASQEVSCDLHKGENRIKATLHVSNVNLWWPVGYGAQPLYSLVAKFVDTNGTAEPATEERKIGFRAVELVTDAYPKQKGKSMYFRVNGVPIFAKGANFVPMDSFENRISKKNISRLIQSSVDANMNIIRVWGGGVYQQDDFYSLCDEKGIMVWQEFMFACAMYPRDESFLDTTAAEVVHQIERLAHHPSIILWSGSNENEAALDWFDVTRNNPRLYVVDYAKLYFDTIRTHLLRVDSSRPFWPSSPSNGVLEENPFVGEWGNPYDLTMGDLHYYNYAPDCTDIANLPSPRFASEYGYQSFPSLLTWRPVTSSAQGDWHPFSPLMLHRQHHLDGNAQILAQIQHYFRYNVSDSVQSFSDYLFLSQCTQALCIKAQSEHYRRSKGMEANTMGAIYWQLNDIWQAPTWSSLEYGGRWKLLHYYVKEFFAPVLVSAYEQPADNLQMWLTSDVTKPLSGVLYLSLWSWNTSSALDLWKSDFAVPSLGSQLIAMQSISALIAGKCKQRADCFLTLKAVDSNGNELASNVYYLARLVDSTLPKQHISIKVTRGSSADEAVIELTSDVAAPFVFLETSIEGRFESNGVLLLPRVSKQIRFFGWAPFDLNALERDLSIRTPRDVY